MLTWGRKQVTKKKKKSPPFPSDHGLLRRTTGITTKTHTTATPQQSYCTICAQDRGLMALLLCMFFYMQVYGIHFIGMTS